MMGTASGAGLRVAAVVLVASALLAAVFAASPGEAEAGRAGGDTTPPVRSDGSPVGTVPSGTTSAILSLKTDEAATCRYATTPGVSYQRMKNTFLSSDGISHSAQVGGLEDGKTYSYYVRCRDLARNANPTDYAIFFTVLSEADCALPPTRADAYAGLFSEAPPSTLPEPVAGTWRAIASPSVESLDPSIIVDNTLTGVDAISENDVWALGEANNPNGPQYEVQTLALHWDGGQWSKVPTPNAPTDWNRLYGVSAASSSDVWAVGMSQDVSSVPMATLIEHWDGTQWTIVPSPSPGSVFNELRGVAAVSATDAWAVGFCAGWYRASTVVLHWDGAGWSRVPSPSPETGSGDNRLFGISAISANDVWAVGITSSSMSAFAPLALHWDGVAWSETPASTLYGGGYGSFFRSVSGVSSDDVLAVGASAFPAGLEGGVRYVAFAAHWDGTAWTQILDINPIDSDEYYSSTNFYGVSAVSHDFAWVVGEAMGDAWIYNWNGTALNEVPAPDLPWYNTLYAVDALTTDNAWAVGRFAIEGVSGTKTLTEQYSVP